MIGLAKSNVSLGDTIDYNLKHKSLIFYTNKLQGENISDYRSQMEDLQKCYRGGGKGKNLCAHVQLSPSIENGKQMSMDDWKKISDLYLNQMGLENNQALGFIHSDHEHLHLHMIISRINEQTFRLFDDSFIGKKTSRAAHEIAGIMGLTRARDVMEENKKREKEVGLGTAQPSLDNPLGSKQIFKAFLKELYKQTHKDLDAFFKAIEKGGYEVTKYKEKDKQTIRGYGITKNGTLLNASEIDRNMNIKNIKIGEQAQTVLIENKKESPEEAILENKKETPEKAILENKKELPKEAILENRQIIKRSKMRM